MSEPIEITITIDEGDIVKFNNVWWEVENLPRGTSLDMNPMNIGKIKNMGKQDLEERIEFSGQFQLIRKEFADVIDH